MGGNKFEIQIPKEDRRDFASLPENEKELRVGDYIDISNEDYFNWFKKDLTNEEKKKELKRFPTKVRISVVEIETEKEIVKDENGNEKEIVKVTKIVVQTGNQQIKIEPSPFLNYSQSINK